MNTRGLDVISGRIAISWFDEAAGPHKILLRLREGVADVSDPGDGGRPRIGVWLCAIPLPNLPCVSCRPRPSHRDNLATQRGRLWIIQFA